MTASSAFSQDPANPDIRYQPRDYTSLSELDPATLAGDIKDYEKHLKELEGVTSKKSL